MSILAILTAVVLHVSAHADSMNPSSCTLEADLVGDAQLWLQNGLDSWSGASTITCDSWEPDDVTHTARRSWNVTKPVNVVFRGTTAYGWNVNARVHMKLDIITSLSPWDFQFRAPVHAKIEGNIIRWEAESYNNYLTIAVERDNASTGACETLNKGTLFIQNPPPKTPLWTD